MPNLNEECGYWLSTVDHSQDVEIRSSKDGRIFAIKNIRQEFTGYTMALKADISGDKQAAKEYLKAYAQGVTSTLTRDNTS